LSLLCFLKKEYRKFGLNSKSFFKISKENQIKYLNYLGEAKTPADRSYKQYKCQTYIMNNLFVGLLNLFSFFALPIFLLKLKKNSKHPCKEKSDAVFISNGISTNVIPQTLIKRYNKIKMINFTENLSLTKEDIKYLKTLKEWHKYPPYFKLKVYLKMAIYSSAIRLYEPLAFISYCESSFTSQIITEWLEQKNIKNINIMHGEKLFLISDSYAYFSEFFVWDKHYKDLMIEMKAEESQFIIEQPSKFKNTKIPVKQPEFFLTYYLSDEGEKGIIKIAKSLDILKNKGMNCKVRLHPRGNNYEVVRKYLKDFIIEDPSSIDLYESFADTEFLCSLNSTVLYEGFMLGKKVVIDDYSDKHKYETQKELGYIMINKEHLLLSELIIGENV